MPTPAGAYLVASRLLPRVAPRALVVPGLLVAAGGLALLAGLDPSSGYLSRIVPAELLLGLGMGGVFTPAITVATGGVDRRDAGVASAVANTAMQVGSSVGTAVLNTIAVTATAAYLSAHQGAGDAAALVHGYATATGAAAGVLLVVAIACAVLIRPRPAARVDQGRFTQSKASGKVAS